MNKVDLQLADSILESWRDALGKDFKAYRNHVCRVTHLCYLLSPLNDMEEAQIQVAAAFHDLGIWTQGHLDYLEPSVELASKYLKKQKLKTWIEPVSSMIRDHHRITQSPLPIANVFRMADWIDVSMGQLRFGLPKRPVQEIQRAFPDAGFHLFLGKQALRQLLRKPWKPLPMLRW